MTVLVGDAAGQAADDGVHATGAPVGAKIAETHDTIFGRGVELTADEGHAVDERQAVGQDLLVLEAVIAVEVAQSHDGEHGLSRRR